MPSELPLDPAPKGNHAHSDQAHPSQSASSTPIESSAGVQGEARRQGREGEEGEIL